MKVMQINKGKGVFCKIGGYVSLLATWPVVVMRKGYNIKEKTFWKRGNK